MNIADSLVSGGLLLLAGSSIGSGNQIEKDFAEYFTVLVLLSLERQRLLRP